MFHCLGGLFNIEMHFLEEGETGWLILHWVKIAKAYIASNL